MSDAGTTRFNAACAALAGRPEDEVLEKLTRIADDEQLVMSSSPETRAEWLKRTAANVSFGSGWSPLR